LIGASESRFVMGAGLFVEYLVLLPLGYLLSWVFGLGINGAYIALCLRSLANCFIVGRQFFSVKSWERSQPIMPAIQQKVVPNSKAVPGWIFKQDKSQND
jgi:Na+-driven multidrug efflux pump